MVSIVLSTYNRARTLKETIDSILGQTYMDFELIIVDDGSTDNTLELLHSYEDERIRLFPLQENQYYCIAANFGIQQARGRYVACATSDDTWEPEKLELQIDYLEKRPECGACFTISDVINETGERTDEEFCMLSGLLLQNYHTRKEWIQRFIFEGNCLCHPSAVVRRTVLDDVGYYNLLFCQSADMDLWLRIIRKYQIHVINKKLVRYRCYKDPKDQVSGADEMKAARFVNEHMIIRRTFIRDLSTEEMIKFFDDCFQDKDACSPQEIEIEKAFLLMRCAKGLPDFHILGIEKFEEILRDPELFRILREKYGVKIQDIYRWNLGHFYMDFGIHTRLAQRDRTILTLEERLEERKKEEEERARRQEEERQALLEEIRRQREEIRDREEQIREREKQIHDREEEIHDREGQIREREEQIQKCEEEIERQKEKVKESREQRLDAQFRLSMKERELEESQEEQRKASSLLKAALLENLQIKESRK